MSQLRLEMDAEPAGPHTFGVGELIDAINGVLVKGFRDGVWVRGEIQGWSERGPHAYFKLVEHGEPGPGRDGRAVLNVGFFAPARVRLRPVFERNRLRLGDGVSVRVFGRIDVHPASGQLSLKMTDVDPRFTLGELAMQRNQVVQRLVASGAFDANRQRRLVAVPLRVGVVTSTQGAAWADFVHEIERSGFGFTLRVADVRVQGSGAAPMIARAVARLGAAPDLDAVVVIRGGGARTELATFDDERICRAIAASGLPVITGLGHEIDRAIADDVAHTAFKTPTAAAGGLVERVAAFVRGLDERGSRVAVAARRRLDGAEQRTAMARHAVARHAVTAVQRADDRLDRQCERLARSSGRALDRAGASLDAAIVTLTRLGPRLDDELRHLQTQAALVRQADPSLTLARGWSITRTTDGRTVRDASTLAPGEQIVTTFARGIATSTVDAIHTDTEDPT